MSISSHDDKFIITGGQQLGGEISVRGAKNAALKALAASLILDEPSKILNVPDIEDISRLVEIMEDIGVEISKDGADYTISNPKILKSHIEPHLHQKTRSSMMLAAPILMQHGEVTFAYPGGCVIGNRPIDFFLQGFREFGIEVEDHDNGYTLKAKQLRPAKIVFTRISVTGTEAMMMLACKTPGRSEIINAAMEPEVVALAEFLNSCGAKISGIGSPHLVIDGVEKLNGGEYITIPDRIEAGTFAILAAATNSEITVTGINPNHLEVLWQFFKQIGINFSLSENSVTVKPATKPLQAIRKDIVTHEYPGFPTDLQAPMTVLMTQAQGSSLIFETIYEGRLFYIDKLNSMGANIFMADPHRVMVNGPTRLNGKKISSPDIRAGMAMVIAALIATGETELDNIYQIDRGYERIEERLQAIGAKIVRVAALPEPLK
ncbi:UDP-N-acetylglucosamine 1-carboxyvinyltransferase [bacterium]|nr:MAG: UDP-N-acetylglucosamine 1-carboxyvinyltransferase [bacterium]